ncbi:M24 family metallopeptidase [Variovorax paradoxus]|uniref:Putative peptidase n=1 Tax=Variovorax paradoxus TaxID=34073 RepID=A0A0H2LRE1_VARPD|nr:M24 family metallopeptidase [Variovorax paradoxus]KLN52814.1 putative peptidase [Variovorax paradoxus]
MSAIERLQALRGLARDAGLDAFVGVSTSYHNFLDPDPVLVATGCKPVGLSAFVLDGQGLLKVLVTPAWDVERMRRAVPDASIQGVDDIPGALASLLSSSKHIGIAGLGNLPFRMAARIRTAVSARSIDGDEMLRLAGNIDTAHRRAAAVKAVQIAETAYDHLLAIARPGMRERELAAELHVIARSLGADDNFMLINGSQHGRGITVAGDRSLERGDVLVVEITPSVEGQFVQLPRTAVFGEPSKQLVSDFAMLRRASLAGIEAAKPGAKVSWMADVMNRVLAEAGYGDYCKAPYMRVRGHGMGNIANQPGDVTSDNQGEIKEGMIFVIHPEQYLPTVGYVLVGEPVRIDARGAVPLTSRPGQLDVIGA